MPDLPETVHGFRDGDHVRHETWGTTGTVRIRHESDPEADPIVAEVFWHNAVLTDELDERLAASLVRL